MPEQIRPALPGLGRGDDHSGTARGESSPGILLELAFAKARDIPVELLGWGEIRPLLEEETIRALEQGLAGR